MGTRQIKVISCSRSYAVVYLSAVYLCYNTIFIGNRKNYGSAEVFMTGTAVYTKFCQFFTYLFAFFTVSVGESYAKCPVRKTDTKRFQGFFALNAPVFKIFNCAWRLFEFFVIVVYYLL